MARLAGFIVIAALLAGCSGGDRSEPRGRAAATRADTSAAAESVATALRAALDDRSRAPATLDYGEFAEPRTGAPLQGYVVRLSGPYAMVAGETAPHEWLADHLRATGWTLDAEADGPDGASYRALRGELALYVVATWEDLQPPVEVADWYAVTAGLVASDAGRSRPSH